MCTFGDLCRRGDQDPRHGNWAVVVRTKEGKAKQLAKTIQDKILPILEGQPGFVDEVVLISDTEPHQILALSFWNKQEDADLYTHEQFPKSTN
jgi:heme-degrading monooxygenase HmoA